jgi:hypothetical protein
MNIINEKSEPNKHLREQINEQLSNHFGIDTISGLPIWRVSWAPDHWEKRFGVWEDFGQGGIFLRRVTEMREIKKYPHLPNHYVFERLVLVPPQQQKELCGAKISYEPIHPFWDTNGNPLPPNWEVCQIIVQTIYWRLGKGPNPTAQYNDPEADGNNGLEAQKERVRKIKEGLYGNNTAISDALDERTAVFLDERLQMADTGKKPN